MQKLSVFILAAALLLTACATAQTPTATPVSTKAASAATVDTSKATPEVGSATVRKIEGVKAIQLLSRPEAGSPVSAEAYPDEQGKYLGSDPSGRWVLVQFGDRTGWALFQLFDLTIVQ